LENYREVTVLCAPSKLLEMVITRRLDAYVEAAGVLEDEQGGFRRGRQTEDQPFILHEIVQDRRSSGKLTIVSFLDVKTAYDGVYRNKLYRQLFDAGVRGNVWFLIKSMYDDVVRHVRVAGGWTRDFSLKTGLLHTLPFTRL
jgi:hypothetical protein